MAAKSKPNELTITRIYDAPVKAVWEAWADPKKAAHWWGPRGYTITTKSKDLRPGGKWIYTMHGPDGVDYSNITTYFEVDKYSRLVYDHGANETQGPLFRVTVLFSEENGKTTMQMTMALATEEAAKETKKFVKKALGNSTWDRLAEFLEKEDSGKDKFVINRTFEAPIAKMFDMFTKPEHFSKWLPPTGFEMRFLRSEIKEGASTFYVMENADGIKMYGRAEYLEIKKPNRIVYTQQFCDEKENITRPAFAPTWPETMFTKITLTDEAADSTRVTIEWQPHGKVTAEELKTFIDERTGMTMGWSGSFEKLEQLLGTTSF